MLTLCMTGLPAAALEGIVARQLEPFGRAVSINVVPPRERGHYGVITVKMETLREAEHLAHEIGDCQFGSMVVIRLLLIQLAKLPAARGVSK